MEFLWCFLSFAGGPCFQAPSISPSSRRFASQSLPVVGLSAPLSLAVSWVLAVAHMHGIRHVLCVTCHSDVVVIAFAVSFCIFHVAFVVPPPLLLSAYSLRLLCPCQVVSRSMLLPEPDLPQLTADGSLVW